MTMETNDKHNLTTAQNGENKNDVTENKSDEVAEAREIIKNINKKQQEAFLKIAENRATISTGSYWSLNLD